MNWLNDWHHWLNDVEQLSTLLELLVLALCAVLAWGATALLRRGLVGQGAAAPIWLGRHAVDGVMFPLMLLALTYISKTLLATVLPNAVLRVAVPIMLALVAIRLGVKVLYAAFGNAPWVRVLERTISWLAWAVVALWFSGVLPLVLESLDQIHWKMGNTTVSVRSLLEGLLTAGLVLIVALWVSSVAEDRLLRSATGGELSVRKAISNALRGLLLFIGLLVALAAAGIDLTALSVLGGAVGVGVGFGLQKLAANYVSGFVILAERSMRIGDTIRIDGFEGRVTDIKARYTIIRSLTGRESVVPNELLITSRVENLSLADKQVWQSSVVTVGYDADVKQVSTLLLQAATSQPRVLADPAPAAYLSAFLPDGLEFTVGYWIADPESGTLNVRSQLNLSILRALREHHITIPYPQRVVHMVRRDVQDK